MNLFQQGRRFYPEAVTRLLVRIPECGASSPINPYGRTKLHIEEMLADIAAADPEWRVSLLRYFNPVRAHASGDIGEDPRGTPNNLMPFICQVAVGQRDRLLIFGDDYPQPQRVKSAPVRR